MDSWELCQQLQVAHQDLEASIAAEIRRLVAGASGVREQVVAEIQLTAHLSAALGIARRLVEAERYTTN